MGLDYGALRFWMDFAQIIVMVVIGIYAWIISRSKANNTAISKTNKRINDQEKRLIRIENEINHLPSGSDFRAMTARMESIAQSVAEMSGTMKGVNRAVDLMNQHLLSNQGDHKV